ncbi:MAG: glycine--tRNA ligase [Candidatus Parvarchaeum sp.]
MESESNLDDEITNLALSRGIFFHTADIFNDNISGFWEYGPVGLRIFNNLLLQWRKLVYSMGGLEISGSVIVPKKVLKASGHEQNFFDMEIKCSKCGAVYRVDKLLEEKERGKSFEGLSEQEYLDYIKEYNIKCSKCGGELTEIKKFGTMFPLSVGEGIPAYLRPEACQSIFLDFERVFDTNGRKLPLVVAQVGKAFRNEISPRNSLLRQREFYQNDIEIFFLEDNFDIADDSEIQIYDKEVNETLKLKASEALSKGIIKNKVTAYALSKMHGFLLSIGFPAESIRFRKLYEDKAFYAQESFDLEVNKTGTWVELVACNHRGTHDLSAYEEYGAKVVRIADKIPNIFELSMGTDRLLYLLLASSFKKDSKRRWLSLNSKVSPFKAAIFPLVSKDGLDSKAKTIFNNSIYYEDLLYSEAGSIGKRYRKAEEIGVKLAFTIDYETIEDETVTVRESDSMKQFRIHLKYLDILIKDSDSNDFNILKEKYEYH